MDALVEGVAGLLAVGVGGMAVVAGEEIGALSPDQVDAVTIARRKMVGTSRLGRNARGQWNQMGGTMRDCEVKLCLPS